MITAEALNALPDVPLHELREDAIACKKVLDSPVWALYGEIVNRQLAERINSMMTPAGTIEAVLAGEGRKGEYRGLLLAMKLLPGVLEMLNGELDRRRELEEPRT